MCQRCPHSPVMGNSPDSIQDTTSQPLDDTRQAQDTQTRRLALCHCHTSLNLSEEVRHVAISERAGDAHSLTPCDNWLIVQRGENARHSTRGIVCRAQGRTPECQSGEARGKNRAYFMNRNPTGLKVREAAPLAATGMSPQTTKLGGNDTKEGCRQDDANGGVLQTAMLGAV